ncbi:hypothetical protein EN873_22735 [bacterium M00.F.Ca.ET.230.01.1.1]|nr:hypothetical protein EN873_22735 [bacterium M00.F.Ca.ET.230.01.1.1]
MGQLGCSHVSKIIERRRAFSGELAAAYLTLPAVSYFQASGLPVPGADDDTTTLAAAFLIGDSAMWIS